MAMCKRSTENAGVDRLWDRRTDSSSSAAWKSRSNPAAQSTRRALSNVIMKEHLILAADISVIK
jgi:hypothetical protein